MHKIFIVEDNSAHLEIAKAFLGQKGYEVICATTGYEAIDKLSGCNPDLILIDILLPDISGFDVLNFIKSTEKFNNIPVLAISASAMPHEIKTALDKGFDEFISKPIQFSPFLELIQKKLEQNKKTNVLVVDDNYINAELLKETLSQLNYNVKCIHRGQEVLETLEKDGYDLVLLDIMMPEMSGYDVIRLIKEKPALQDIPVIFISALNSTKNIVKGFELGSYDYITKPFNLEELKSKVKAIIKIKQLQDKLKEKKDTLEKIYKYCTDAILTVDNELKIVSCSSIFCDWVRMSEDEIRNKFFYEIVEYKNDATFNGEIIFDDITIKQPYRILEAKGSEIKNSKNEKEGYIIILRDVTTFREIEKQKETFIATLTHDLKTPVRAEIRAMELLLNNHFGNLNTAQREILAEILNSSKYMFSMVDSLLAKYKYENCELSLKKEEIDLNQIILNCCNELRIIADEQNQKIVTDLQPGCLIAEIDPVEFKRVVINIILNSIKCSPNNSLINVSTYKQDSEIKIKIADNGIGISKEKLPHIFDKYVSYTDKFRPVGTGLGLYISKKLIELHNGKICVDSEEGRGSTFTVSVPFKASTASV